jgi:hypothetical protein
VRPTLARRGRIGEVFLGGGHVVGEHSLLRAQQSKDLPP